MAAWGTRGYDHHAIAECGDPEVAEEFMPIIHLVFSNLKNWLNGIHHGVSAKHLQAYLNEFTFRLQQAVLPVQRLPLIARNRRRGRGSNLRRAIFR